MVTVSGRLEGQEVSATRNDDGEVQGDTDLLVAIGACVERGARVSYWPWGSATASLGDDRDFAITVAGLVEEPFIEGLPDDPDDRAGEIY